MSWHAARLTLALALSGALAPAVPVLAEPSRNVADYVILAGDELIAKRLVVEAGDVGVNSGFLQSKKGVRGPGSRFVADQVRIGDASQCLELSGNDVIQTGSACQLAAGFVGPLFPSLAEACGFPASPTACDPSRPILVPHKATQVLSAGVYGDVSVAGGSPGRASLVLEGGAYSFCSLQVGVRARLHAQEPSTVYVAGKVTLGMGTVTGPAPGSNLGAADVRLFAGDRARLQRHALLTGFLCAPDALLHLNHGSRLVGRGVGKLVHVGRVTVRGVGPGSPTTTIAPPTTSSTSSTTTTSLGTSTTSSTLGTSTTSTTSSTLGTSTTSTTSTTASTVTSTSSTTTSLGTSSTTSTTSTTSTSAAAPSSTSTSVPEPTTTSTSSSTTSTEIVPTTSSTSTSTTTTSSTSSTVPTAVCGNNAVENPETCDDGNTVDGDFCPSNCIIESCPDPQFDAPRQNVDITVNATLGTGQKLGTVLLMLNYPEGGVIIPGSADGVVASISMTPAGANCLPNDLDYALLQGCSSFSGYNPGLFTRVAFVPCGGTTPPVAGDFVCTVREATDQLGVNVTATCTVSLP